MVDTLLRRTEDVRVYGVITNSYWQNSILVLKKVQVYKSIIIFKTDRLLVLNTSLNSTFEHFNSPYMLRMQGTSM